MLVCYASYAASLAVFFGCMESEELTNSQLVVLVTCIMHLITHISYIVIV